MPQTWLENGARAGQVYSMGRRIGWFWHVEVVLRQRNHEVGIIVQTESFNGTSRADPTGRILTKCYKLFFCHQ